MSIEKHQEPNASTTMIEITGKNGTAKIMCDMRDELAISHIYRIMSAGVTENTTVRVMPDYHEGKGSVIGFTQVLDKNDLRVCPNVVGVDIGCRISSYRLSKLDDIDFKVLDDWIRANIPLGAGGYLPHGLDKFQLMLVTDEEMKLFAEAERLMAEDGKDGYVMKVPVMGQLCSIGSGNHFIALNRDSEGSIWLSLHCGSRNFGLAVCNIYQRHAEELCDDRCEPEMRFLDRSSPYLDHYLTCLHACQVFSEVNHRILSWTIGDFICRQFGEYGMVYIPDDHITTIHNYIDLDHMIVRKGAISARKGERVLIPFNMRDGIAVGVGKGNEDYNWSAPHGAGRLFSRAEAKRVLDLDECKREMAEHGVFTTSLDYALDEAAGAYKDKEMILSAISPTVEVKETMAEIYNIKGK